MKKAFVVMLVLVMLAVTSCVKVAETVAEKKMEAETGANVDIDGNKVTIESDEGKVEIESNIEDSEEWCKEGSNWKMTATGEEEGSANMVIKGLMTSGKYEGLCHVEYIIVSEGETTTMDLYLDEEGGGYQVVQADGQTFEMEWHG
ncbi:hypothetical protein JXC34_05615 [Candidatus Woesearchaeota archaeon]|nr:hypothetical protein [Candidatus Woesearchaeota archaeon]